MANEVVKSRANPPRPSHTEKSWSPDVAALFAIGPVPKSRVRLAYAYEQVVWVYRAVNAYSEQVANVPFLFSIGERGCEDLISSVPCQDRPTEFSLLFGRLIDDFLLYY